jgi:2-iminobutanoate/2-iminopropanoate deaminase
VTAPDEPPYSRTRTAGPLLLTAGILGRRDGALVDGGTEAELRQALANLDGLLAGEGLDRSDVVRLVVYLADMGDMAVLNTVFVEHFDEPRPARTTVEVSALPGGARVEIEATAARR